MADKLYPCEGYANVYFVREEANIQPNTRFLAHKYMVPFLDRLVRLRPKWVFKTHRGTIANNSHGGIDLIATYFDVFQGDEMLGEIGVNTTARTGEVKADYLYDTERLRDGRQRGSWNKTTKMDKAVKSILKAFYPKTVGERVEEGREAVASKLNANVSRKFHQFNDLFRSLGSELTHFIMDNWEEMEPRLRAAGACVREGTLNAFEEWKTMQSLQEARSEGRGYDIIIRGSDYIMSSVVDGDVKVDIKSTEQLPESIRRDLGLLKLTDVGTILPEIGLRQSSNTYFVKEEANND